MEQEVAILRRQSYIVAPLNRLDLGLGALGEADTATRRFQIRT